jgi:hypothetical protein
MFWAIRASRDVKDEDECEISFFTTVSTRARAA